MLDLAQMLKTESRPPSARLKHEVVRFVSSNATVEGFPLEFIIALTATADCMRRNNLARVHCLLERMHLFSIEGIERMRTHPEEVAEEQKPYEEVSFRAYAGAAAKELFLAENAVNADWGIESHAQHKKSAEAAEEISKKNSDGQMKMLKHAAHSYGFAGEVARLVHEFYKRTFLTVGQKEFTADGTIMHVEWAHHWNNDYFKCAELASSSSDMARLEASAQRNIMRASRVLLDHSQSPVYAQYIIDANNRYLELGGPQRDRDNTIRAILLENKRMEVFIRARVK
jgi:hypothetical protein